MLDEERVVYAPAVSRLNSVWQRVLSAFLLTAPLIAAIAWRISCL